MIYSQTNFTFPIGEDRELWIEIVAAKEGASVLIHDCRNACSWSRDMRPRGEALVIPASLLPELIERLRTIKDSLADPN